MARRKFSWTANQVDKLSKVKSILTELQEYKPLTLRQVYYQLVSQGHIENTVSQYGMLSNLLKWARLDGYIDWSDIEDRVRVFSYLSGWTNSKHFLGAALEQTFNQYSRDLWQTQSSYVEVWIEKDALRSIFERACGRYGISVVVCRGFSSVSFLHDFKVRLVKLVKQDNRDPVMLYFGDFDPSGVEMLEAMKTTLTEEMGVDGLVFNRIALQKDDIFTYKLPHNPNALKKSDTRSRKHVDAYGELAVELDALSPQVLEEKISNAIEAEITDVEAYNAEVDKSNIEIAELQTIKKRVLDSL